MKKRKNFEAKLELLKSNPVSEKDHSFFNIFHDKKSMQGFIMMINIPTVGRSRENPIPQLYFGAFFLNILKVADFDRKLYATGIL